MTARILRSPFPDIELAKSDLLSFLISNPYNIDQTAPLFVDASSSKMYTYREVMDRTRSLAHGLRSLGIQAEHNVAIFSPNCIDYPIFCYAILGCGATVVPISAALTAQELHYQLKSSRARLLIVHVSLLGAAREAVKDTGVEVILPDRNPDSLPYHSPNTVEKLIGIYPPSNVVTTPETLLDTQPAFICFSSGTTGPVKGVMITYSNLTANLQQWENLFYSQTPYSRTAVAFLPFSHIYAINVYICGALFRGMTTVILSRFDLDTYMKTIQQYRPQELQLVPPVALQLAKDPRVKNYDMSSVRSVLSAAAPLSAELASSLEGRFKDEFGTNVYCHQSWGMTETSPLATGLPPNRMDKRRTVGSIVPNMELRLVNHETLQDVADQSGHGEMWCRGPNVTRGYFFNDAANRDTFHVDDDGSRWLRTGDIGSIDEEGFVTIHDRIKEMIKYKGLQVIPSELEGKLLEHPDINDCGVTSVWNEDQATELPIAFVVLKPTAQSDPPEQVSRRIHEWINTRVASYKRIRGGIKFVHVIPKSSSGKILRRELRGMLTPKKSEAKL